MYSQWKYYVIYTSSLLNDVYHSLNPETFITLSVYFCLLDNMKITSERAGRIRSQIGPLGLFMKKHVESYIG